MPGNLAECCVVAGQGIERDPGSHLALLPRLSWASLDVHLSHASRCPHNLSMLASLHTMAEVTWPHLQAQCPSPERAQPAAGENACQPHPWGSAPSPGLWASFCLSAGHLAHTVTSLPPRGLPLLANIHDSLLCVALLRRVPTRSERAEL